MMAGFGLRYLDKTTLLEEYLSRDSKLDNIAAQMVIRDAYETQFGIHDHANPRSNPLALVECHEKENFHEYGALYRTFYQYHLYEVHKEWGVSIVDFLNMPREFCSLMLRISAEKAAKMTPSLNQQAEALKLYNQTTGLGGVKK